MLGTAVGNAVVASFEILFDSDEEQGKVVAETGNSCR
jgi:hypothetical protein